MGTIQEAYKWMLTPIKERNLRGNLKTRWENTRISLNNGNWMEAISDMLIKQEIAYAQWLPFHLRETLESWYWREDQRDYPLEKLWGDFCRFHYLPRLVTYSVLVGTVHGGIRSKEYFGYAEGKEDGQYSGLVFGKDGRVYFDDPASSCIPKWPPSRWKKNKNKKAMTEMVAMGVTTARMEETKAMEEAKTVEMAAKAMKNKKKPNAASTARL